MPVGTRILAVDDGRVSKLALDPNGLGVYAKITHDWGESLYAHLSFHTIWLGAIVGRGQQIGVSGNTGNSTGPHLHFGIRPFPLATGNGYNGYIDPAPYLTLEGVDVAAATNIVSGGARRTSHSSCPCQSGRQTRIHRGRAFLART